MLTQQLEYLSALARERHFGRAARACHVSQPTLSAAIRRLEDELAVPLVVRGRRYEGLTPEGERMLAWAHRVLGDLDGMRRDLEAMRSGLAGRLRIGAIPTSLPALSLLTTPLCREHPGLDVSIVSHSSAEIEDGLRRSQLDVGVTYLDNEPLAGVRTLALYEERYLLLTSPGGPHHGAERVSWRAAAREPLCLLTPDMQNRRIVDRIFERAGVAPRPVVETNSVTVLCGHVRDGLACGVVPHAWLHVFGEVAGLHAVPLTGDAERNAIGLVWLDRDPEPLLTHAFVTSAARADLERSLRA